MKFKMGITLAFNETIIAVDGIWLCKFGYYDGIMLCGIYDKLEIDGIDMI